MKYLVLVILAFSTLPAFTKTFDYKTYNQLVNKAELAITRNEFAHALEFYDAAFKLTEKPFVADIYNASICAMKDNQIKAIKRYCNMLASAGVGGNFFEKNTIYRPMAKEKGWKTLIETADQIRNSFLRRNKDLLHILDSMAEKDQRVNHEWRAAGFGNNTPERERMDLTYDTLSRDLYHIFDSIGFVSEQMIGAVTRTIPRSTTA